MTHFWKHVVSHTHTESQWNPVESLSVYHISMSRSRLKADNWRLSSVRAAILSVAPSHCHPATINNSQAETPREAEGRCSCRKHRGKELRKHKMRTGTTDERELEVWDEEGESNSIMNPGGEMRWDEMRWDEMSRREEAQHMLAAPAGGYK